MIHDQVPAIVECDWQLCSLKAKAEPKDLKCNNNSATNDEMEIFELTDGSEADDLTGIHCFSIIAMYKTIRYLFSELDMNGKIIGNGVLTRIAVDKPTSMNNLFELNTSLIISIYHIMYLHINVPPSVSNLMGVFLGDISDLIEEAKEKQIQLLALRTIYSLAVYSRFEQ
jgi:hypothetical protein